MLKKIVLMSLFLALVFPLMSCHMRTPDQPTQHHLKIGLMPAFNSIPLIIAQHKGYFNQHDLQVELIMFPGQLEREAALQTGHIDGTITDVLNVITARASGFPLKITSLTTGSFVVLASPQSQLTTFSDWNARDIVRTGIIENSIVVYITEQLAYNEGVRMNRISWVSVPQVPVRLEMLLQGKIDAACLPEPLATLAQVQGAVKIAASDANGTTGVLAFTENSINDNQEALQKFYKAYNRAIKEVNNPQEDYISIIIEEGNFPQGIKEALQLPHFAPARLPDRQEVAAIVYWLLDKGVIQSPVDWCDLVEEGFAEPND